MISISDTASLLRYCLRLLPPLLYNFAYTWLANWVTFTFDIMRMFRSQWSSWTAWLYGPSRPSWRHRCNGSYRHTNSGHQTTICPTGSRVSRYVAIRVRENVYSNRLQKTLKRFINVLNSLPADVDFSSFPRFKQSVEQVHCSQFLQCDVL